MKTLTKNLFALSMTALILSSSAVHTFAADAGKVTSGPDGPLTFNKILISGNVIVVVKQGPKERVAVDGGYDHSRTSIKRKGYTLMISSSEWEAITVTVTVKDLHRIDASGNALVKTDGKVDLKYLQVFLKDTAKAVVKANTESLYTSVSGNSDLKLLGSTQDHTILRDRVSKLNVEGLAALKSTIDSTGRENMVVAKTN